MDKEKNKQEFEDLLRSTKREGIDYVIGDLEHDGFFEAPASAGHHLNVAGGLCQHSLNVCHAAMMIYEGMEKLDPASTGKVKRESVIIASLLHDVCKTDIYHRTVKKRKNKVTGMWEDTEGYGISYKKFPMGHGEKSVIQLLLSGLALQDDEMLAIRWHMGAFGLNLNSYEDERCYDTARMEYPLCSIVQCADSLAAAIMETTSEDLDEL
ncbi:HD domain-containing protein [uncultured Prevotella sp.]|uniref:HD domain-containing protein n=1 Tax=uncultured Prevotella sp. TaxID=159272 RepID=UPI00258489AE|nr:HD domain-containing protein [uncultured Prevotella sp.]